MTFNGSLLSLTGSQITSGDLTVQGNLTATQFIISSSVSYFTQSFSSGSTKFGDTLNDTHQFTGSVNITSSLNDYGDINLEDSPIYSNKAGTVAPGAFGGFPLQYNVAFITSFPNNNYAVTVTGFDLRNWTVLNKTLDGFTINPNSNVALVGDTHWIAVPHNS